MSADIIRFSAPESLNERIRELDALGVPSQLIANEVGLRKAQVDHRIRHRNDPAKPGSLEWRRARVERMKAHQAAYPSQSYCFPEPA